MKKLSELLKGIQIKNFYGRLDREVNSLVIDSREAGEGSVFFAIKGRRFNGHDFILDAYKKGCRVFIVEREISGLKDSTLIITDNSRMAFSIASSNFYNNPSGKLNVYGITGST
ncbi:MAG TPA: UDP-N-acetylmuramoyl-L-alanyl-D-glutamate--2,6-diaminopimelate ligase, partial [Firmicutes bacterium]|nr:UDP-N-acetylmuramoyl-L-alanyl-D-glutamate--2,6-diaminopimelate ligase [Bacillota bacterium]